MAVLIRTGDVPAVGRVEAWRGVVADVLGPLDVRIDPDAPLSGQIEGGQLGPVGVGRVLTSTPHSVHRTPGLIRRGGPEMYRAVLVVSGRPLLSQDGRTARLGPGDFALYDFARPYDLAYDSAVQLAVFSLPREQLVLPAGAGREALSVPIATDQGTAAVLGPLLRRVTLDVETYQPASAVRLSTVVMELISTTVAERMERTESLPGPALERALLLRIHAFIEGHLGDAELSPPIVAAAHHISLRQLHRLFETRQTTVAAWIRLRRLEGCRKDLADPAQHAVPVSAIAAKWGLPDSAHFSRLFRRTYGLSPAEFRRGRHASSSGRH